ncbi:hypothetical protein OH492_11330 [Vibrio chagasii]|nr:hypothetical protein [Vibrio chagasii]
MSSLVTNGYDSGAFTEQQLDTATWQSTRRQQRQMRPRQQKRFDSETRYVHGIAY